LKVMLDDSRAVLAGVSHDVRGYIMQAISCLVEQSENNHAPTLGGHVLEGGRKMLSTSSQTPTPTPTPTSQPARSAEDLLKEVSNIEQADELFAASPALQREFGSPSILWHYCDAQRRGVVRWQGPPAKTTAPAKPVLRRIDDAVLLGLGVTEARAAELWRSSEALQAEFSTASELWAYVVARQNGRARIMAPVVKS
jgi:hypothetical protein